MKAKITLFVLIASLLGGSYWYYDINKYTMPKTLEVTPWAKGKVQEQLSRVNKPITLEDIKKAYDFFANSKPVIYFSIRKGTVKITTPNAGLRKITYFKVLNYVIENFAKKELLKDNDFLIALSDDGDGLTLPPELSHVPVFVFAKNKSKENNVVRLLIVDPFTLKSWCEIYKTLEKGLKEYPWDKKINKLFWRGKTSDSVDVTEIRLNSPRVSLAKLTKQFPDRYDARLTKILSTGAAQIKQVKELCGEPVAFASTKEHLPFKYQITLDGVTAT